MVESVENTANEMSSTSALCNFAFFFDSHIFPKKKKLSDGYLFPHESASPASSLVLQLRETGRLSNCNYILTHSATFCNHPSNSPALGCCKLRLREFVQQITLSHPCNRKAEFRAQEKPQLPSAGWSLASWKLARALVRRDLAQGKALSLGPQDRKSVV